MRRPRLNVLRVFEAAGRHLSFSSAAEELNISQAAVSQQIRQLETYLDARLFVRHHRRLTLTSNGSAYLVGVHEALDRLDAITDQLFPDRSQQIATLRCTSSVATLWLAPKLGAFQKRHPEIDLRIRTLDQDLTGRNLIGAELEIIILGKTKQHARALKLFSATVTPVCSPELFSSTTRPKTPKDLLDYQLIHVVGYEDDWHRWFRQHQADDIAVPYGLSFDGSLIAIEAAQRGDGIMLGRRPFIDHHLQSGELVEIFSAPLHLHADYYLQQRSGNKNQKAAKIVTNWLVDLAAGGSIENSADLLAGPISRQ